MRSVDREHCYRFYRLYSCSGSLWQSELLLKISHDATYSQNLTSKSSNNIQKPLACVAKWLLKNFQGTVCSIASLTLCYSLLLAHSLLDLSLCGHLKAAPAVCLHVSHPADGLDLGVVGSPVIPMLERAHFKHVLVATVAGVLVAHPAVWGSRDTHELNS